MSIWDFYSNLSWADNLPFRHTLDKALRVANIVKSCAMRSRPYAIEFWRVAVTNACNAACVFCTYPLAKGIRHTRMSYEMFHKALPLLASNATEVVDLTPAIGDPLLDVGLSKKVDALATIGKKATWTTNGILLRRNTEWIMEKAKHISKIQVSVPSFVAADYPEQFGVSEGDGAAALNALVHFIMENTTAGQPIKVSIRVRNRVPKRVIKRQPGYQRIATILTGKTKLYWTPIWDNWSGVVDLSKWSGHMLRRLRWTPQSQKPCMNLRTALLNPNGTVRLCGCLVVDTDQDDMVIGTVGTPMDELNRKGALIRDGFYSGKRPVVCRGCSFYNPEP